MSRCISCNKPMSGGISINTDTGKEETMCNSCISISSTEYSFSSDKEYQHQDCDSMIDRQNGKAGYYYDFFDNTFN